eukprot:TRINITY_DN10436_c0_g2_i1.p1 TRINITY_DN10436_c0_g2~~TRINITY_DN10436_c0_g2_i1.p1  ORF type:complete len:233 (-),score=61.63 TRINITY_DN10436_c0_g2_i1:64-762(-)
MSSHLHLALLWLLTSHFCRAAEELALAQNSAGLQRPLSIEERQRIRTTLWAQQQEVEQLWAERERLLHEQAAQALALAGKPMAAGEMEAETSGANTSELLANFMNAEAQAAACEKAYKEHLTALVHAKKDRDELKRETDAARKEYEEVAPMYHAAEFEYTALLSKTSYLEDRAKVSSVELDRETPIWHAALAVMEKSKSTVDSAHARLEAAVAKLNELDKQLMRIKERMRTA